MLKKVLASLPWASLFILLFVGSLYLAWAVLAKLNFLYPLGYRIIEIDKTILQFAPENLYKKNFALTGRDEHFRLFEEIVSGVINDGQGLDTIYYHHPDGRAIDTLLTRAEITHLDDVANLVSFIDSTGTNALAISLLLVIALKWKKCKYPSVFKYHIAFATIVLFTVLLVIGIGAEKVFYEAHILIFPDDHQWFFYYQESLMTTMMKAPDLFAVIALELLFIALALYSLSIFSLRYVVGCTKTRSLKS